MATWNRFPGLKGGTPKQRKWACSIRQRVIRDLERRQIYELHLAENGEDYDQKTITRVLCLRDALYEKRDFTWWIANRENFCALDGIEATLQARVKQGNNG